MGRAMESNRYNWRQMYTEQSALFTVCRICGILATEVMDMATIRVDSELKKEADEKFESVGMSTPVAVKIFLTRFVQTGQFPFTIEVPEEQPNDETLAAFAETKKIVAQENPGTKESLNDYRKRMRAEAAAEDDHAKA